MEPNTNTNINLILSTSQFNVNNIFFCEPIKNNIIANGNFIRILYSTDLFTLNGIYILLNITNTSIEKYYNKHKYIFDINKHLETIDFIKKMEETLLLKIKNDKIPRYSIYDQVIQGNIKLICEHTDKITNKLLLKISGIWETEEEYGITYKFIHP